MHLSIYESDFEELARGCIAKYGHCEEHNYEHFLCLGNKKKKPVFVDVDGYGILAFKHENGRVWWVMREVLAPKEKRTAILLDFANYVLNELKANKLWVEPEDESRKALLARLKDYKLGACKVAYFLDLPLFDMGVWDDKMQGKEWKKLRNIKNKFYRKHHVEVAGFEYRDKKELKRIVLDWKKKRTAKDSVHLHEYMHMIDSGFSGFDELRVLIVDGGGQGL